MCKAARAIRVIAQAAPDAIPASEAAEEISCDAAAEKNNNSRNASSTDIYSLSGAASSTTSAWNYDQVHINVYVLVLNHTWMNPKKIYMSIYHGLQQIFRCMLSPRVDRTLYAP